MGEDGLRATQQQGCVQAGPPARPAPPTPPLLDAELEMCVGPVLAHGCARCPGALLPSTLTVPPAAHPLRYKDEGFRLVGKGLAKPDFVPKDVTLLPGQGTGGDSKATAA